MQQDSDYEANKEKFNHLEDRIEELTQDLSSQKEHYEKCIEDLKCQIDASSNQRTELESTIKSMTEKLEMVMKDKQQFSKDQERTLNIESDIAELKQMAHQQSGLSSKKCLNNFEKEQQLDFNTRFHEVLQQIKFKYFSLDFKRLYRG